MPIFLFNVLMNSRKARAATKSVTFVDPEKAAAKKKKRKFTGANGGSEDDDDEVTEVGKGFTNLDAANAPRSILKKADDNPEGGEPKESYGYIVNRFNTTGGKNKTVLAVCEYKGGKNYFYADEKVPNKFKKGTSVRFVASEESIHFRKAGKKIVEIYVETELCVKDRQQTACMGSTSQPEKEGRSPTSSLLMRSA